MSTQRVHGTLANPAWNMQDESDYSLILFRNENLFFLLVVWASEIGETYPEYKWKIPTMKILLSCTFVAHFVTRVQLYH